MTERPPRPPAIDRRGTAVYNARLVRREDETDSLAYFWVRFDGEPTPFEPGQYMTIGVMVDGKIVQRPYSVASPPAVAGTEGYEFYVRRVQGGTFTPLLFELPGRPPDADDRAEGQVHARSRTTSGCTSSSRRGPATRRSSSMMRQLLHRRPAAPGGLPERRLVRPRARLPRAARGLGAVRRVPGDVTSRRSRARRPGERGLDRAARAASRRSSAPSSTSSA